MSFRSIARITALLLCTAILPGTAQAQSYDIIDLGTLGGPASAALGINNFGDVAGWADTADGRRHAFLYRAGAMTDLATLPGGSASEATAINDLGQVTGVSGINAYGPMFREFNQGFLWQDGSLRALGALHCPCSFNTRYGTSAAFGISNFGWVVGWSETVRGTWVRHAFLWQHGTMADIGGGAGDWSISRAFGVNDLGQIVGDFAQDAGRLATYDRRASLWQDGVRQDLGTLAGHGSSTALAVNRRGQVVGGSGSSDGSVVRPFLWQDGVMRDLGTLPGDAAGRALAISDAGQVVGWSGVPDGSASRAFLWRDGVMLDLNLLLPADSGWRLTQAAAINNLGQIAGTGVHAGRVRAFLLTPSRLAVARSWLLDLLGGLRRRLGE